METTTFEDKISQFSGFTQAKLEITAPIALSTDLEFKRLSILAGMNNTGKSFLNKLTWAAATFLNMKIIEKITGLSDPDRTDEDVFQFILDNIFSANDLTGAAEFNSRDEILKVAYFNLRFELKDGKLTWLKFNFPNDARPMGAIIYLSKDARDFTNIERYLKTKKMAGITELKEWKDIETVCDMWKLYDVFAIESLLTKIEKADELLKTLKNMSAAQELLNEFDVVSINYDKEQMKIEYENSKGQVKPISTMGLGSQSILNMLLSSI